jgi:hypothetical protein
MRITRRRARDRARRRSRVPAGDPLAVKTTLGALGHTYYELTKFDESIATTVKPSSCSSDPSRIRSTSRGSSTTGRTA